MLMSSSTSSTPTSTDTPPPPNLTNSTNNANNDKDKESSKDKEEENVNGKEIHHDIASFKRSEYHNGFVQLQYAFYYLNYLYICIIT